MQKYLKYSSKELDGRYKSAPNKYKKVNGKYTKEDWNAIMRKYREKKRILGFAFSLTNREKCGIIGE